MTSGINPAGLILRPAGFVQDIGSRARRLSRRTATVEPGAESLGRMGHPGRTDRRLDLAIAIRPALLRDVLTRLLDTVPDVRVVGYGENEDQIRKVVRKLRPGVLLFDYEAMGPNGESM